MRARSSEASVCPARTSTPPRRARKGKMWPGRAKSAARVAGSMAARMVVARSAALMPVVTPRRASMDSVKAVPKAEVFTGDMGGRCSSSQRSSVRARQIRPRPYLAMKLMAAGVIFSAGKARSPSFSRSSSSTRTIWRPWRKSSAASSAVANWMGIGSLLPRQGAYLGGGDFLHGREWNDKAVQRRDRVHIKIQLLDIAVQKDGGGVGARSRGRRIGRGRGEIVGLHQDFVLGQID